MKRRSTLFAYVVILAAVAGHVQCQNLLRISTDNILSIKDTSNFGIVMQNDFSVTHPATGIGRG